MPRACRKAIPVPGTLAVIAGPCGPIVARRGPTPTDVERPRGERVIRTPGRGLNDFLKRQPIAYLHIVFICHAERLGPPDGAQYGGRWFVRVR